MASRPPIAIAVSFSLGFYHKSQKSSHVFSKAKVWNGKTHGFSLLYQNEDQNGFGHDLSFPYQNEDQNEFGHDLSFFTKIKTKINLVMI